jgi:hypothetical protein
MYEQARAQLLAGEPVSAPGLGGQLRRHGTRVGVWQAVAVEVLPRPWIGDPQDNHKRLCRVLAHLLFGSGLRSAAQRRVRTCG